MILLKALSLLIKPVSGTCNMRCKYCFYADVADNRAVKSHGKMTLETLEAIVKRALSEVTDLCVFGFQGGEPTLIGLDFFRALIDYEKAYNINKVKVMHLIQTNGLLLNEEWAGFLAENHFLTGLSIDGEKTVHDSLRLDASGKGTHNRCVNTARLLKKYGVEYNILSVITRQLASHPDRMYRFYKNHGFHYIQLIPCLDGLNEAHGFHKHSLNAQAYGKFLCRLFDLWYEDYKKDVYYSIRAFDNYISMLCGMPPENCAMSGVCSAYPLIEADGNVYPCDFYAVDEYLLGNIRTHSLEEMLSGKISTEFISVSKPIHPQCKGCEYLYICRGGCRRDREAYEDKSLGINYYCEAYKMFFKHSLSRMQRIAHYLSLSAR